MFSNTHTLNLGDVIYKIEPAESQVFRSKCRVCNGERTLTVNGVTFKCPMCDKEETTIQIRGYKVTRYRVYHVTEEVRHDTWKPATLVCVKYGIYTKSMRGACSGATLTSVLYERDLASGSPLIDNEDISYRFYERVVFTDYKKAVSFADKLTQKSLESLEEFNKAHGTDFVAKKFNFKHDKKSK